MANVYDIGDEVRLSVEFTQDDEYADPTDVELMIRYFNGEQVSYLYSDDEIARDDTGRYHKIIFLDDGSIVSDDLYYRWEATGVLIAAEEKTISVRRSAFY